MVRDKELQRETKRDTAPGSSKQNRFAAQMVRDKNDKERKYDKKRDKERHRETK